MERVQFNNLQNMIVYERRQRHGEQLYNSFELKEKSIKSKDEVKKQLVEAQQAAIRQKAQKNKEVIESQIRKARYRAYVQ